MFSITDLVVKLLTFKQKQQANLTHHYDMNAWLDLRTYFIHKKYIDLALVTTHIPCKKSLTHRYTQAHSTRNEQSYCLYASFAIFKCSSIIQYKYIIQVL